MSKSESASDMATIYLMDDADEITKKIRRARTDPEPLPSEQEGLADRPEAANLVGIFSALADKTVPEVLADYGGQGFGAFKPALAELAVSVLAPQAAEMRRLVADPGELDRILKDGADRARAIAQNTMDEVRAIVGFVR